MTLTALEIKSKHPFTLSMLSAQISTLIIYQLVFLTFIKHNEFSFPTQDLCICWPLEIEYLPLCLPSIVSPSHFGRGGGAEVPPSSRELLMSFLFKLLPALPFPVLLTTENCFICGSVSERNIFPDSNTNLESRLSLLTDISPAFN